MSPPPEMPTPHRKDGANDKGLCRPETQIQISRSADRQLHWCRCQSCRWVRSADRAIDTNSHAQVEGDPQYTLVSDVFLMEALANGLDKIPNTHRMVRGDGRSAYVFTTPAVAA